MKIKKLTLTNHPILGNLELDFTDEHGKAVDTIIFAGENGCGKTTVLSLIYQITSEKPTDMQKHEEWIATIELTDDLFNYLQSAPPQTLIISHKNEYAVERDNFLPEMKVTLKRNFHSVLVAEKRFLNKESEEIEALNTESYNVFTRASDEFRSIFSDVEVNFNPDEIKNVTAKSLDEAQQSIRTPKDLATQITQLIIDVQALDDSDFSEWGRKNVGNAIEADKIDSRMRRFKDAFSYMFPTKLYKRVNNINGNKKVIFEEYGKEITIENLSSGEKQIVFRGSFLLKDQRTNTGVIVLIDEPEISLHPSWQLQILDFYKKLFTNNEGIQTSQIFVATHSPFIIHNENRYNDKIIVLGRNEDGQIKVKTDSKFYDWTRERLVEEAFSLDFKKLASAEKPIIFVEGTTDIDYLAKAAEHLGKIDIISRISLKDGGGDNLKNLWNILTNSASKIFRQNTLILHDCDVNIVPSYVANLFRNKIEKIERTYLNTGIENLFPDSLIESAIRHKDAFIDIKPAPKIRGELKGTTRYEVNSNEKRNLCDWICQNAIKDDFKDFEKVFKIIEETILK